MIGIDVKLLSQLVKVNIDTTNGEARCRHYRVMNGEREYVYVAWFYIHRYSRVENNTYYILQFKPEIL